MIIKLGKFVPSPQVLIYNDGINPMFRFIVKEQEPLVTSASLDKDVILSKKYEVLNPNQTVTETVEGTWNITKACCGKPSKKVYLINMFEVIE